jgi:serine/threonine-protein kinase
MYCPRCHAENRDDSKFCGNCGAPLGLAEAALTQTLETPVQTIRPGTVVAGKYKILEELGHGGMGVVYKAEDFKLKRFVALKFLPPHLMDEPGLKERFLIEAQAAAALSHPNICVIHEVGESDVQPYIAMEYVEGETLRDRLKKGPLKPEEAVDFVNQIAAGLAEAHGKGIVHRDVKSANIMVTAKGQAKVMDFGLAKLRGGSSLTKSQTTLGTVAFMSPEQARGEELDQRTDIWSLGVVLYELLTGELPFKGDHDQTVIHAILHKAPKPPSQLRPGLPSGLDEIVLKALVKKMGNRYQRMEEVRGDLAAVAEGLRPLKARLPPKLLGIRTAYVYSALAVALIIGLDVGGLRSRIFGGDAGSERVIKLAVLPLSNLSGDPEQEYLSDGLTQEMIAQLGRLHPQGLSVIARTSVLRYKKTETPVDQIGRELGVEYVLEGSARREGSRIRIAAELVKVKDQALLWADSYEREISGILALQNDVAQNVARALALKLLPAEQARLAVAPMINAEAYDAVLKGSYHWRKLTAPEFDTAQRYFELALAKDPSYVPAYRGLAAVWSGRRQMGIMPTRDVAAQWKAATLRAVALDENSLEAHDALGSYLTWYEWDWAGAEPEWRKTIELDPNDAANQAYYSHFLAITGRLDEAVTHIDLAVKLDPFNELILGLHAAVLNFVGRYEEAAAAARKALSLQPDSPIAISQLDIALFMLGRHDEILSLRRKNYADDPERLAALELGYTEGGFKGALRRVADLLAARYEKSASRTGTVGLAMTYLKAGDKDKAIEWLEKAFEDRDGNLPYIGRPIWDPLRDDPRFQDLLRRMKLPMGDRK